MVHPGRVWVKVGDTPPKIAGYTYRSSKRTRTNGGERERLVTYRRKLTWRQEQARLTRHNQLAQKGLRAFISGLSIACCKQL